MPEVMEHGPAIVDEHRPGLGKRETVVLDTRVVSGSGGGPDKTILNSPRFLVGTGYRMLCAYMHAPEDPGFEHLRRRAAEWGAPLLLGPRPRAAGLAGPHADAGDLPA